jgi:hypothetical protein
MSVNSGYGKISTSGLTFGYDVGETKNSFKGKPTTNYVTNASTMANFGNYSCGTPVTFTTEFGTTGYRMSNLGSWNGVVMGGISLPSTGTYTFSAYIRYIGGSANNNGGTVYTSGFGIGDTAAYHSKSSPGEWIRVSNTQNCTGTNGTFYLISFGGTYCDDFSSWEVTMPQIEAGSFATPFVDGSRSVTQGLLDIVGLTTIDLSASSFDANGKPVLDGTDDRIDLGNVSDYFPSSVSAVTVEQVFKIASGASGNDGPLFENYRFNLWYSYSSDIVSLATRSGPPDTVGYQFTVSGNATVACQSKTNYNHIVGIYETISATDGRVRLYINGQSAGVYVDTKMGAYPIYGTWIGQSNHSGYGTYKLNGQVDVTKVYNRALTENEILNNYQQYKGRFSLPSVKDGSTQALAAPSATYLKNLGISKDGNYWLQPSGQSAFQVPVKFYLNKAMVCVMKGGNGSGYVPDSSYWENTTLDNQNDFTLTNGVSSKYQSYNVVPFTEFYWTMGELNYQSTFSLASEVSSMYAAQTRSWNSSANRSSPHFGNSIDYRSLVGADRRYTSALGTEIYLMGMDLKHEGHYGGGGGSSGGRIRVGSILDESTGNTGALSYGAAGSAFGIGVNGGNPLKTGVCGYAGWTEPSIIGGADNWSLWVVF